MEWKDPVTAKWYISKTENGVVWYDACSLATDIVSELSDGEAEGSA